ncbi:tyrosine-protein kinase Etk/Wzc [Paraburkholderia sp. BL6665CI2N2]|uniref:polysaccharide biosynthesis tyrosine autokinase n=1 Tax=Paraburkholderia sp. BL6665CI2N2 TaxID=1938806 RepID=UPI00106497BB|nr:polysaccharide biosynthesis tyrosine autokinase [Paraburkholderia sp. BL6665CI2N2]TDY16893.1 tyrosine-protein kinase Etk/Wzc [Paraburkholderia sp. BL6665CI2N2]
MTEKDPSQVDEDIDLMAMLDLLLKSWRMIGAVAGCFLLLGALWMIVATPVYRADITVQVEDSTDLASDAINNVVGGLSSLFNIKSTDDGEMEILHSRLVTDSAVDHLKLYIDARPKRFPFIGSWIARHTNGAPTPGLFGFGGYAWGREKIDVTQFDVPTGYEGDKFTVRFTGLRQYRLSGGDLERDVDGRIGELLTVNTDDGVVKLLISGIAAPLGTEFRLRRHSRQKVLEDLRKSLNIAEKGKDQSGVLGVTYDDPNPELASAVLNEIAGSYVRQNQQRKIETVDQSLQFLKDQLPDVRRNLELAEDRLTAYQNRQKIVDLSEQTKAVLDQSVQTQAALFDLNRKRTELLATLSPRHPSVIALDRQIAAAHASLADYESQLKKVPNDQQGFVRLTRDARVQTEIYVGLLNSIQQLDLARAGGVGNVRIIDRAVVAEEPVRPKAIIVLPLSFVIGLFVGIVFSISRVVLAGRITDPADIERRTLLDVMAAIPFSDAQRQMSRIAARGVAGPAVLAIRIPRDPSVEALRSLRVAVQFALAEKTGARLVLVTGPTEGVGKSFTSANLAVLLGLADKRVLLIDADLRRGHLHAEFGLFGNRVGLSDVLRGTSSIEAATAPSVATNVDLLGAGSLVGQPDELLEKSHVADIFQRIAAQYDVVLIDSPPVLRVTDTTILASVADLVLLVTKSGVSTRGEILETVKRLQRGGASVRNIVFNSFKVGLRSQQYGYGRYYQTDDMPVHTQRRRAARGADGN